LPVGHERTDLATDAQAGTRPRLWEMPGSEPGETGWPRAIDPQAQPAPDYEFDRRVAWWKKTDWSAIEPKF